MKFFIHIVIINGIMDKSNEYYDCLVIKICEGDIMDRNNDNNNRTIQKWCKENVMVQHISNFSWDIIMFHFNII